MVNSFVVAAEENEVSGGCEFPGEGLFEDLSLRGEEDDFGAVLSELLNGGEDGLWFEKHALSTTAQIVVCFSVFVLGPFSEVVGVDFHESGILGAFDDALAERGEGYFGK